jgi:hypothetical protein
MPASPQATKPTHPARPVAPATMATAPVEVSKCGAPVTGVKGTKPCVKDAGHEGKHSTRVYNAIDTSTITMDDVKVESFAANERVTVLTDPGTRSDIQKRIDADVLEAFNAWKSNGKPETLKGALAARYETNGNQLTVAKRYWVQPSQEAAWRKMLRSAAALHGIQVRIYPVQQHTSGRHQLPWFAREMRTRQVKPTTMQSPAAK